MTLYDVQKDGTNVDLILTDGDVVAGTWAEYISNLYVTNHYIANITDANNDEITFPLSLGKGTYDVHFVYTTSSESGKLDISLDSQVIINQLDLYSAATIRNVIHEESNIVLKGGDYKLSLKANGKNAASTAYHLTGVYISFRRVA